MKYLGALIFLLAFCACQIVAPPTSPKTEVLPLLDTTVALWEMHKEEPHTYCAAVWISEQTLITAAHCTDSKDVVSYYGFGDTPEKGSHSAVVVKRSMELDLALLEAVGPMPGHVWSHMADARIGEPVSVVGHPAGMTWSYLRGWVSAVRYDMEGPDPIVGPFLQVSAPIWGGNSGGGVYNDRGELLGVASFMMRVPCMGFFIPSSTMRAFLK